MEQYKLRDLLSDKPRMAGQWNIIQGPAGSGKTALVSMVLHELRIPGSVIWVNFNEWQSIEKAWADALEQWQQEGLKKAIVVIDDVPPMNVRESEAFEQMIYRWRGLNSVITTTRQTGFIRKPTVVSLMGLSRLEMHGLIRSITNAELTPELLEQVWVSTEGMPLAVELWAELVNGYGIAAGERMLRGMLYNVEESESGLWLPSDAAPRIISVNEDLIKRLKLEPESIYQLTPRKFEEVLAELLTDMGMEVELTQVSKDDGRDIMARFDAGTGKMLCLVEAKRYRKDRKVGIELVKQLFGTLCDSQATSAMLVTTSSFTGGAKEFQKKYKWKMDLRDYGGVVDWIEGYKTGKNRKLRGS